MTNTAMTVKMFTTTWCGYCKGTKRYLDSKGVTYEEIDIEQHPEYGEQSLDASAFAPSRAQPPHVQRGIARIDAQNPANEPRGQVRHQRGGLAGEIARGPQAVGDLVDGPRDDSAHREESRSLALAEVIEEYEGLIARLLDSSR